MTLALSFYRGLSRSLSPLVPMLYKHRLAKGKEARKMAPRPAGQLVWMHGASIGESKLLLGLAEALAERRPNLSFLFTSHTASSAAIVAESLPPRATQQMAPIDTPADLCVFAEGEVWPNLLKASRDHGAKTALINARMTAKSLKGWHRMSKSAKRVFNHFDLILAADDLTAGGLAPLADQNVHTTGNVKTALAAKTSKSSTRAGSDDVPLFPTAELIILGASTHAGEEALLLDALAGLPATPRLILAPRHPARADDIEALIAQTGRPYVRRSRGQAITPETQILLADTFGEMDTWYKASSRVYLGGGHAQGIGGHSPLEPLSFGLPIITGPHTENFSDTYPELYKNNWARTASTHEDIITHLRDMPLPDAEELADYFKSCETALTQTLDALGHLLSMKAAS